MDYENALYRQSSISSLRDASERWRENKAKDWDLNISILMVTLVVWLMVLV